MDSYRDRLRVLAPHYLVMFILILIVLMVVDLVVEDLSFTRRLILVIFIGVFYPLTLRALGRAPEPWQ